MVCGLRFDEYEAYFPFGGWYLSSFLSGFEFARIRIDVEYSLVSEFGGDDATGPLTGGS